MHIEFCCRSRYVSLDTTLAEEKVHGKFLFVNVESWRIGRFDKRSFNASGLQAMGFVPATSANARFCRLSFPQHQYGQ